MSVHPRQTYETSRIAHSTLTLAHSVVELEAGPAGVVARVEYAGPLPDATVAALREVSA